MKKLILVMVFVFATGSVMNAGNLSVENPKDEKVNLLIEKSIIIDIDFYGSLSLEEEVLFGCLTDAINHVDAFVAFMEVDVTMEEWSRMFRIAAQKFCNGGF